MQIVRSWFWKIPGRNQKVPRGAVAEAVPDTCTVISETFQANNSVTFRGGAARSVDPSLEPLCDITGNVCLVLVPGF